MKRDEAACFVLRVDRGDERVDRRLDEAVGNANREGGGKQHQEVRRRDRGDGAGNVTGCGKPQQRAHSQQIAQRPAQQDGKAEPPERGAGDPPDVGLAEPELALEIAHDVAANGKRHRGCDERYAAGDEQPARRGGYHGADSLPAEWCAGTCDEM